jgi:hypothetical protein
VGQVLARIAPGAGQREGPALARRVGQAELLPFATFVQRLQAVEDGLARGVLRVAGEGVDPDGERPAPLVAHV